MFSLNPQDNEIIKRLDNAIKSFGCLHDSILEPKYNQHLIDYQIV